MLLLLLLLLLGGSRTSSACLAEAPDVDGPAATLKRRQGQGSSVSHPLTLAPPPTLARKPQILLVHEALPPQEGSLSAAKVQRKLRLFSWESLFLIAPLFRGFSRPPSHVRCSRSPARSVRLGSLGIY